MNSVVATPGWLVVLVVIACSGNERERDYPAASDAGGGAGGALAESGTATDGAALDGSLAACEARAPKVRGCITGPIPYFTEAGSSGVRLATSAVVTASGPAAAEPECFEASNVGVAGDAAPAPEVYQGLAPKGGAWPELVPVWWQLSDTSGARWTVGVIVPGAHADQLPVGTEVLLRFERHEYELTRGAILSLSIGADTVVLAALGATPIPDGDVTVSEGAPVCTADCGAETEAVVSVGEATLTVPPGDTIEYEGFAVTALLSRSGPPECADGGPWLELGIARQGAR